MISSQKKVMFCQLLINWMAVRKIFLYQYLSENLNFAFGSAAETILQIFQFPNPLE